MPNKVLNASFFNNFDEVSNHAASETINSTKGTRKAETTLITIEGPWVLPKCSYMLLQSCFWAQSPHWLVSICQSHK